MSKRVVESVLGLVSVSLWHLTRKTAAARQPEWRSLQINPNREVDCWPNNTMHAIPTNIVWHFYQHSHIMPLWSAKFQGEGTVLVEGLRSAMFARSAAPVQS